MNVGHYTAIARAICAPHKVYVHYEFSRGCFCWNFYRNGRLLDSTKDAEKVVKIAENIVDMGK
jgi:hypothetical protein